MLLLPKDKFSVHLFFFSGNVLRSLCLVISLTFFVTSLVFGNFLSVGEKNPQNIMKTSQLLRWHWKPKHMKLVSGRWLEDGQNDWKSPSYLPPQLKKLWYAQTEQSTGRAVLKSETEKQNERYHQGLHPNGDGPFEREMKRRGVPVDKYTLPTTVGVRRLHEAVQLRRQTLEKKSAEAMEVQRGKLKKDRPSAWYDERDGPLNPHFLSFAQKSFSQDICTLPRTPYIASTEKRKADGP